MAGGRRYTIEQANAALPELRPLLEQLRDAQRIMSERHDEVLEGVGGNGGGGAGREFLEASQAAGRSLAEIGALGIIVRDAESGLVDFPSEREGREVFLCWRLGEEAVGWWHPATSGFSDRRPLS